MHVLGVDLHARSARAVRERPQRREGRADRELHVLERGHARQQRLNVFLGLALGLVHLPVARHQRGARHAHATPAPSSASRAGSARPSISASVAPPPVERWSTACASPNRSRAAAESPPPTTVTPRARAIASATVRVPCAKGASSKAPMGPFQNTDPARSISVA